MSDRQPSPERLDVPRTLRELYPNARSSRLLRVTAPGEMPNSDRGLRWLRRAVELVVFVVVTGVMSVVAAATRVSEGVSVRLGADAASATGAALFRSSTRWFPWQRWARARGAHLTRHIPNSRLIDPKLVELPHGDVPSYRVLVGGRSIGVAICAVAVRGSGATHHGAYVAQVRLPDAVGERFPGSSLVRRRGLGLIDAVEHAGESLELESINLRDDARLQVQGGSELDWRQLFDPALVDLLAAGIHVEWYQRGSELLLHAAAPMAAVEAADPDRLDALCVAAAAIERRFATIVGDGHAVAPAPVHWQLERVAAGRLRHLSRERARDLALDPDELFAELARFTSADEVAAIRAKVDSGEFPLDWLDDLVHHRRAAFWGNADVA